MVDVISIIEDFKNYTFDRKYDMIFSMDDEYYELIEIRDKIQDVNKMPDYIKNDWYKYNSIPLTEKTLDKHIEKANKTLMYEQKRADFNINDIDYAKKNLIYLKAIKRNFRIDSIL